MLNTSDVLYSRAKPSEILQGILDTVVLLNLEKEKLYRFYHFPTPYNELDMFWNKLYSLQSDTYMVTRVIEELSRKGL